MEFQVRNVGEFAVVDVDRNIEEDKAFALQGEVLGLLDKGRSSIALNLSGVSFLSSHTIGVIVALWRKAKATGGEMHIISTTPVVAELLNFCSANKMIELFSSESQWRKARGIPADTREHLGVRHKGKYKIIDITRSITVTSGYHELGATINELFEKGEKFVGLNLSESESFFSEMAGLIKKWNWKIKETGGCFCLIEPNVQTRRRLSLMGLDRFVAVYDREEEIVAKAVPAGA